MKYIFLGLSLLTVCTTGQFPWNFVGFNPTQFTAGLQSQLQGMSAGLQNMGANIQSMTRNIVANSIQQAQMSFSAAISDNIRRAQEAGTSFDFSDLRPGEFRRFTDREGNTRGFSFRSADGLSSTFNLFSSGHGSSYLFSNGPRGFQVITY